MCKNADPADLLVWYDQNARVLPWRTSPQARAAGIMPDPYAVWLSEIMLQQTGVVVVINYFNRFLSLWPDVQALAAADETQLMGEWAGLGYYARARNLAKCAGQIVRDHGGVFPQSRKVLETLPGIGPYTSAAIAAIAFDQGETVVDGNVERVMARIHAVTAPMPASKPQLRDLATHLTPAKRPGDYAQAVMDLGATICTPRSPKCGICPWKNACAARTKSIQATLPARVKKAAKPTRYGTAYLARRSDGAWLLERRPNKGLLGGMLGWPGSEWGETHPPSSPPITANWRDPGVEIRHTFTHFHLQLSLQVASLTPDAAPQQGFFLPAKDFRLTDLPSVMRKAHQVAAQALN